MTVAARATGGPRRSLRWSSVDARHALPLCVAVSMAAHLLLITMRTPSELPRHAAHWPVGSPTALQVRLVQAGPSVSSGIRPIEKTMTAAPLRTREPTSPARPHITAHSIPTTGTTGTGAAEQFPIDTPTAAEPDTPLIATSTVTAPQEDYVPRPLLSKPPVAQTPVIIATPDSESAAGRQVGILSLFIDENGHVQHVAANDSGLPPAFEQAAREAFTAAQFSPGRIDGRAVKSRMRVEVVFE